MQSMMYEFSREVGIGNCAVCHTRKLVVEMDGDRFCRQCINDSEHLKVMIG